MSGPTVEGHRSAECALAAARPAYERLHDDCRQTKDVPLPYGGGAVLVPRCACPCHRQGAEGER